MTDTARVDTLEDGQEFSLDGENWHTCAVVLFGSVAVYTTGMRGPDAMCRRIDVERDAEVFIR
jgi:hypothetical protein